MHSDYLTDSLAVKGRREEQPWCPSNLPICQALSDVSEAICPFDSQSARDHLCAAASPRGRFKSERDGIWNEARY